MSSAIIKQIIEQVNDLPNNLQQQVVNVVNLRQQHSQLLGDVWDVLESLTGTVEAPPAHWAAEHDHYLYGTPKR